MDARARKALGCFVLLAYLALYAAAAATLGGMLTPILPGWTLLAFYAVAGVAWVLPLKPLFVWMNQSDRQ